MKLIKLQPTYNNLRCLGATEEETNLEITRTSFKSSLHKKRNMEGKRKRQKPHTTPLKMSKETTENPEHAPVFTNSTSTVLTKSSGKTFYE